MSTDYYLMTALEEWQGRQQERHFRNPFADVLSDLVSSMASWPSNCLHLLEPQNWRYEKLRVRADLKHVRDLIGCRLPRIALRVEITSKDNLVLEWLPRKLNADRYERIGPDGRYQLDENYDFHLFSSARPIGSDPENRIVMIRGFNKLGQYEKEKNGSYRQKFSKAESSLLEAVKSHLTDVRNALSRIFDVEVETDLRFEYSNEEKRMDRRLIGFKVEAASAHQERA